MRWSIGSPPFQWQGEINQESEQWRGLVGLWSFPESATTIIKNRTQRPNLDATLYSGAYVGATEMGYALTTDGTNDYASIAATAQLNNPYVTLSCWFKSSNTGSNKMMIMKAHTSHSNPYYLLGMRHAGSNALYMDVTVNGTWYSMGGFIAPNDTWNHAALSYDGTKILCMTNGVLRQTITVTGTAATTNTPLLFGANNNLSKTSTYCFQGSLADIRLYNRGMSELELFQLYDPQTRWELYAMPRPQYWFVPTVAPGGIIPRIMHHRKQQAMS